jgi:DNA-binding MarR family transcriptional regulator
LVKRLPDPKDRRGTLVRLTANGCKVADHAIALHFEALADALLDMKRGEDRQQLTALLAKLLSAIEWRRGRATRE